MKKVLVTGGAGFIGSNVSNRLVYEGYDVTVIDNLSPQIHGENQTNSYLYLSLDKKIKFYMNDIRNYDLVSKIINDIDIVIHLASETGTGQSMYSILNYTDVNASGTATLLQAIINSNRSIKKFVLASSRSVYGEGKYICSKCGIVYPPGRSVENFSNCDFNMKCNKCGNNVDPAPTDESSLILPQSIYAATKLYQEDLVKITCQSAKIPHIIFRFQNVFGPGQSLNNPYTGIISIFSNQIQNGRNIEVYEDGLESRDFVYIDDVIDAVTSGVHSELSNNVEDNTYNIGSGEKTSVLNVASLLRQAFSSEIEINITGNYRYGDIRHNYADISKAKKYLGFEPKYNFRDGINKFVNWVNAQPIATDRYNESIEQLKSRGLIKG